MFPGGKVRGAKAPIVAAKWIAGIDFGTVRVGIALADPEVKIASAFETYTRQNPAADARYFCRLAREQSLERFVVGLPVHLDGRESQKSREASNSGPGWPKRRRCRSSILTSGLRRRKPNSTCSPPDLTKKKRKQRLDKLAAQIMLTAWLERTEGSTSTPLGLDDR